MQSTFDERNWLVWLVRVRIFILTLLLGIELAVAQFSPAPLPDAAVHQHDPVLVQPLVLLRAAALRSGRSTACRLPCRFSPT